MNLTSTAGRARTAPRAVSGDAAADDQLAVDARGNPESFGPLYTRHVEAVYRYLRARGASDDEATELVAVAFSGPCGTSTAIDSVAVCFAPGSCA
jgi:hypothetical protein